MTTIGTQVPFGVIEPKQIVTDISGKIRIRMRNNAAVRVYIKTDDGIRCFVPIVEFDPWSRDDLWRIDPKMEQGRNIRLA